MKASGLLGEGESFAGDFRIVKLLAQGGMGSVYLAHQNSTGQQRALKVLHAQYAPNAAMRQRFEQEARVTALVRSAHIVQTVGAGIDVVSGHPWIAMELLEGQTLEERYPEGRPASREELSLVMAQLGHGLGAAHDAGIVHRDLKPDNILFCDSQLQGMPFLVKVIDFGIAKQAAVAPKPGTAVMGSPLWMAPEQMNAQSDLTTATDVWAIGLLAFRLLTGRYYWRTAGSSDLLPLIQEISSKERLPASERARELGLEELLPGGFDAWFLRCVQRSPEARFRDAHAAIDAFMIVLGAPPHRFAATLASVAGTEITRAANSLGEPPASRASLLGEGALPPPSGTKTQRLVIRHRDLPSVEAFLDHHGQGISLDGITLSTPRPLPVGTRLRVEVRIAEDRLIGEGLASVASATAREMRLQFAQLRGPLVDQLAKRENAPGLNR